MKTSWTKEKEMELVRAVKKALNAGFHKTEGPKRPDGYSPGFWNAVAILIADGPTSPTASACSTRYPKAVITAKRVYAEEGITEDLKQLDDKWEACSAVVDDYEKDIIEHILDGVEANSKMLKVMLREWGVDRQ